VTKINIYFYRSEVVSEEQLTKGVNTAENTANVNIETTDSGAGGKKTAYTVDQADLLAAQKLNEQNKNQ